MKAVHAKDGVEAHHVVEDFDACVHLVNVLEDRGIVEDTTGFRNMLEEYEHDVINDIRSRLK